MMTKLKSIHRAWIILLALLFIQGGMIGVYGNTLGITFSAIRTDLGFRAGDLSIYYMIRSLVTGFAVGTTSKLFFKGRGKNARKILAILAVISGLSYGAMAFFTKLWHWYLAAAFFGIGQSCISVAIPIILRNWFEKDTGLALGIAMSASGIFGAIFSPIASKLINTFGWRASCIIIAVFTTVMILLPTLFLLDVTPDRLKLKPYGYEEVKTNAAKSTYVERDKPLPNYVFFACLAAIMLPSSIVQFANQIPTFAQVIGYSLAFGATLTSITMVGNLSGKLLLGFLTDRIGLYRSVNLFLATSLISMILMLTGQQSTLLLSIAFILFGFIYSIAATGPGLLFPDVYGPEEYREKLSRFLSMSMFIYAGLSVVFPYIYDFTGSFDLVFVYGIICVVIALVLFNHLRRFSTNKKN